MRTLILGAAGRDFHDFLVLYRDDPSVEVVAFTAAQIPHIEGRRFPAELAGPRYPHGIPVRLERDLERIIAEERVDQVVFAYSDVSIPHVAALAARAVAAGADFVLPGARTMLPSKKPVIGVGAVRTGCGKSQTVRYLLDVFERRGIHAVGIRHPMPYDPDLVSQRVQRFASEADLVAARCTVEEREEYEPYLERGRVVYAGVDYRAILERAEQEAEVILWDGGNNDLGLIRADWSIVLLDPHRPGSSTSYWPSESQVRRAQLLLVAKADTADPAAVEAERRAARALNADAPILAVGSRLTLEGDEAALKGKRVVCVEDGPTTTHGDMPYGAATLLARRAGAEVVDPRPYFLGELAETLRAYPRLGPLVPAMGYGEGQLADLRATLARVPADVVLSGTPIDLARLLRLDRPLMRVRYDLVELPGEPSLADMVAGWLGR